MGGHHIPEATVRQRYQRSICNFFQMYREIADSWEVYDNNQREGYRLVASGHGNEDETILESAIWRQMQEEIRR